MVSMTEGRGRMLRKKIGAGILSDTAVRIRAELEKGATAIVDADGGYGFRPCLFAAETSVRLAREHGIATEPLVNDVD